VFNKSPQKTGHTPPIIVGADSPGDAPLSQPRYGINSIYGEVVSVDVQELPASRGFNLISLLGLLLLLGIAFGFTMLFRNYDLIKGNTNTLWSQVVNSVLHWLNYNVTYILGPIIVVVFIGVMIRVNIIGWLFSGFSLIVSVFFLILRGVINLFFTVLGAIFRGFEYQSDNSRQSGPRSGQIVQNVRLKNGSAFLSVYIFASPHHLLIRERDEIEGYGTAWRGATKLKRVKNHTTGQTWGW
jgi:hypothetical protein